MRKCFVFSAGGEKSSLQGEDFQRRGQMQFEVLEQDGLMVARPADASLANGYALAGGQNDIEQHDCGEFAKDLARFISEAGMMAHLGQRFP